MLFPTESLEHMQTFFWVLLRVGVLVFLLPLFGARDIPALWKAGLSLVISAVIVSTVPRPEAFPERPAEVALAAASEMMLGLVLALEVKFLFSSVQLAGQFMSFQMGFSVSGAIDPQEGGQSTSLSQLLYIFTVLFFFAIEGHHLFIRALANSFHQVPVAAFALKKPLLEVVIRTSADMFLIALKIASPILAALFLSNLCLGIVARTVPQVNILMIGFPLNIGIGFILLGLTVSNIGPLLTDLTRDMGQILHHMMRLM